MNFLETIAAIATPPGYGGIGVLRISGSLSKDVSYKLLQKLPPPRYASYLPCYNNNQKIIDKVIAIYFPEPNSFTGENILEIHGHGGPVILDIILKTVLDVSPNIRIARPGEFSERAFLNNKIDLIQAESIADLINASSKKAAISATNSLQGTFSIQIKNLREKIIKLRTYLEAYINFPEEKIEQLSNKKILHDLDNIIIYVKKLCNQAYQGNILREGIKIVIAGKPNSGKSSLLNLLTEQETAIVSNIAGTTRDILRTYIHINGIPIHLLDTAGLHKSKDKIERIGIQKAWNEMQTADHVVYMVDASKIKYDEIDSIWKNLQKKITKRIPITIIRNKADITQEQININKINDRYTIFSISVKMNLGINALRKHLISNINNTMNDNESNFMARNRHIESLKLVKLHLINSKTLFLSHEYNELIAEELKLAQQILNQMTGSSYSNEILQKIFSTFCIGK